MNLRRASFRLWGVVSLVWVGTVVVEQGEKLCPAWEWKSPAQIATERTKLQAELADMLQVKQNPEPVPPWKQ
jgi:hypothetical protein